MPSSCGPSIVRDGLIACIDASDINSYPRAGTTWYNVGGNAGNFSLTGTPVPAYCGSYFAINNTNTSNIDANIPANFNKTTQSFSLGYWIKQLDNSANTLIESRDGSTLKGYFFDLNYPTSGKMSVFLTFTASGQTVYTSTNSTLTASVPQYIVLTIDRESNVAKFYLNGIIWDVITNINSGSISEPTPAYSIAYDRGGGTTNMQVYSHTHYTKALSSQEVYQNYVMMKDKFGL